MGKEEKVFLRLWGQAGKTVKDCSADEADMVQTKKLFANTLYPALKSYI